MNQEPKKEKKYTIRFLIFLILSATLIGVLIVRSLNCCIPEEVKFEKEIWGSVSDWFTFIATAIGIAFIAKTLESQMKVQKDQNLITLLEKRKYFSDIKPNFEFIGEILNTLYKIEIKISKPAHLYNRSITINDEIINLIDINNKEATQIIFHYIKFPIDFINGYYPISFYYEDVLKNKYYYRGGLILLPNGKIDVIKNCDDLIEECKDIGVVNKKR